MLTGGSSGTPDSSIGVPQDMSGQAIYDQMRNSVAGTGSLYAAEKAAKEVAAKLANAERALRSYQNSIAAGVQGRSGDAAHRAAKPVIDGLMKSQEDLKAFGETAFGQANSFDERAPKLVDVPAQEPSGWSRFSSAVNPFSTADPTNDIDNFNEANQQNKRLFAAYGGQTQGYAGLLPGEKQPEINTFTSVEIYNPKRTPGGGGGDGYGGFGSGSGTGESGATGGGGTSGSGHGYGGYHRDGGASGSGVGGGHQTGHGGVSNGVGDGPADAVGVGNSGGYPSLPQPSDGTSAAAYTPTAAPTAGTGPGTGSISGFGPGGSSAGYGAGSPGGASGGLGTGGFAAGTAGGGFPPGGGGAGSAGGQSGGPATGARAGGLAAAGEPGAGRAAAGGRGGIGAMPPGARGSGAEDKEHETASYLVNDENMDEVVGELPLTAPPVIGE